MTEHEKTCPAGWRMFRCSCYFFSTATASWDEGREDCRTRGADLVVVNDDHEQTFITNFTEKATWIGLNDKDAEGSWKRVDGTPLSFVFWAEHQPDNGGDCSQCGEEDCAHLRGGNLLWNDISCRTSMQWICEKRVKQE
ncbi:C-type lectin domain family 17, member A-like [Nematolebias whitei]|uniref:C-type lectin domain family 17, member A-like n=1 Tax=Nematolebias whitei TaxID=451745 RepID=UPI00189C0079|nr:C-type lectin domain family 17, member A-like [Nematolebias whitei]